MREAAARLRLWREDGVQGVRDVFNVEPDPFQREALELFPRSLRLAIKACVGPGKTALLAWIIWLFLLTRPHPRVAATAITGDNLRDNLWAELAKWRTRSDLLLRGFEWTQTRVFSRQHPATWYASARTWSRAADPETQGQTLAGLHEDYVLAVVDEAGGVPDAVLDAAEGVLANLEEGAGIEAHILAAGNPTHASGPLYRAWHGERELWSRVSVTGDPDDPARSPRVSTDWARQLIRTHGRDSYLVRTRVLGLFPRQSIDALLGVHHFDDAYERGRILAAELGRTGAYTGPRIGALDPGRMGDDPSVFLWRDGTFAQGVEEWSRRDTEYTADAAHRHAVDLELDVLRVDSIGLGAGVVDKLARKDTPYQVVGIHVGGKPTKFGPRKEPRYLNLRAQLFLHLREDLFDTGEISLAPELADTDLEEQGTDLRYGYAKGRDVFQVESKDEYRKRHKGKSPNELDALSLAFANLDSGPEVLLDYYRRRRSAQVDAEKACPDCGKTHPDPATPHPCHPGGGGPVLVRR